MKKKEILVIAITTVMVIFLGSIILFSKFNSKVNTLKPNEEERDLEEKYKFLNTMNEEEIDAIIKNKEDKEKFTNKNLYLYQIDNFVYSLKEIRFVESYIKENYLDLEVVYEGVSLNSRDNSLLSKKGPDEVIVHLKSDIRKYPTQYIIFLKTDEDGNYIVVKDNLKNIN